MASELVTALVQTSLRWEDPEANREHIQTLLSGIKDVDLVVLPEMFTTGFTMEPQNIHPDEENTTIRWLVEQARRLNSAITGSIISNEAGSYYNRLYFVTPEGEITHYNKRHTFTLAGEHLVYQRGGQKVIIDYRGFKICPLICYDLRFPVWSRNTEDFDLLIYVANWPAPRIEAWDTLLKARAIENMVYCIGVNRIGKDDNGLDYIGHSAVYDSLGKTLAFSEAEEVIYAKLDKSHLVETRDKLRFLEDRDSFNLQL